MAVSKKTIAKTEAKVTVEPTTTANKKAEVKSTAAESKSEVKPAAEKAPVKAEVKPAAEKVPVKAEAKPAAEKAPVKAEVKPAAEKVPVKAEVKPAAEKASLKKAPAVKKETKAKKAPAAKKAPGKRATAQPTQEVYIQCFGKEVLAKNVLDNVKMIWTKEMNRKPADIKDVKLYIKPEEGKAYYVINDDITGEVVL